MNIKRSAAGSHSHAIKKKTQMKWKEVDMQRPTPRFVLVQFLWRNIQRNDLPQFTELLTYSEAMLVLDYVDVTGRATVMATAWTSKLDYKTAGFFLKISKEIAKAWR